MYFSIGSTSETPMGVYYVDRAGISYPDGKLSVNARNAIGKLLKEQTFDETTTFNEGSMHDNVEAILDYAEVEDYFVGDMVTGGQLEFKPETTILEGINYTIELSYDWKIAETLDGRIGIASKTDVRFDQPSVFTFVRDHTCWSYSIEFDDSDAASRVCVYSEGNEQSDPVVRAYQNVAFNKWWSQPIHRTKHVKTVNGATQAQVNQLASMLAASYAIAGRPETFAGLFTPQLILGDEVHMVDENGDTEVVGTVTDIRHTFGNKGFYTSFSADSGGRRGRETLKTLIDAVSKSPEQYLGKQAETADGDEVEY